jgi:hypothetical protein
MVISVGTVALGRNNSRRHCGAQSEQWCVGVIYRLSILVSADVSQPIQKIIGINYLMSTDTNNLIFCIGCTMPANTNNISGIRGVTCRCETLTHDEILVCTVRLPDFPSPASTLSPPSARSSPPSMLTP